MTIDSTPHQKSRWLSSLVRQQGKFILAIPVTCLVISLLTFGWLQSNSTKSESWVQHTQKVRLEAQRLLTALLDAESGGRGYEMSHRREFLVSYDLATREILDSLDRLTQLVTDNPSQTQRLQEIRVLVKARLATLEHLLQLVRTQSNNRTPSPESLSQVIAGKQAMDRTKAQINQFIAEEERLQTKRDQHLKQQQQLTWLVLAMSACLGIGGSILAAYLLNRLAHKLSERDRKLKESEARYRVLIENFPNGAVVLFDCELRYLIGNGTGLGVVGLSKEQLEGNTIWELFPPETCEAIEPFYRQAIAGTANTVEIPYADRIYVMHTLPVKNEKGEVLAGMLMTQDITERKQSEEELSRVNRALKTLSECNQVLVRATDESTLLQNICQTITDYGGYHSVWITSAEQQTTRTVRPVAYTSCDPNHLDSSRRTEADPEPEPSLTPTVIQTGKVSLSQNHLASSSQEAVEPEDASSIALPLIINGKPLGTLNICATTAEAFDHAEVKLLTELANDLAYGIMALRNHSERQDSEAKFRAFLETASEAIIVTNANGEIVIFNAKAEELFGYEHTEVLGRTVEFLMPERYQPRHIVHRAIYREQPTRRSMSKTKNLLARRKDGTEFPIDAGLSPVQTKDGTFVMTFLTDITERKQAEEEIKRLNESLKRRAIELETRYQQIVELAEEGIWVIDRESKTTYVNQAMARMLGYTEEEMLGHPIFDFMDAVEGQRDNSNVERRKQGKAEKHEFKLRAKDGKTIWTYMSTSPVLDEHGQLLWSCALVYDITERQQANEQLRESTERISLANSELARATRLKDEFLASMSHELRTPLNAILGLAEALQEEVYGSLTERQRRSLNTIEQSGKHLLELITEILDLSKIESGKMELQIAPVSLQNLCESSLTFVKQQAHEKRLNLMLKIGKDLEEAELDEHRVRQVLVNLLSNAVKFTPDGGEVWLNVDTDPSSETLQFRVTDTGIGIAPENIDKLFKPFVQLDSSLSRRYAGTGLGLALVRRIVELHGGSVSLESQVGKGSQLTVTFPWKQPAQKIVSEPELAQLELPSLHQALIVEDSDAAAKHVARYLAELGSAAYIHSQGEGAVEAALRLDPEVIVLDLLLPTISGWEVLAQLKADPRTRDIPVLVISVMDERSRALALGASEYLLKPISRHQLQSALSKILSTTSERSGNTALVVMPQHKQPSPLILLAEDNEANISTMMDYLQIQGYRVCVARNGGEAVQQAIQQKPDLILMDIQMPEMDGLEAIYRIRAEANLGTIPMIAITALAMPGDRERCLAAGASDYLTKPVSLKKLVSLIEQHLNRNAASNDLSQNL